MVIMGVIGLGVSALQYLSIRNEPNQANCFPFRSTKLTQLLLGLSP